MTDVDRKATLKAAELALVSAVTRSGAAAMTPSPDAELTLADTSTRTLPPAGRDCLATAGPGLPRLSLPECRHLLA